MAMAMKYQYFALWRKVAFALWSACCLVPGVLVALSRNPNAGLHVEKLSGLYGHEVGAYLGYCPPALLAYLLPLLALSPVLLLMAALGGNRPVDTNASRNALRLALFWGALNAAGLLFVILALATRHGGDSQAGGWLLGLWVSLFFSALPSIGLSIFIAAWFRSRRTGLFIGILIAGTLGFVGIYARTVGVLWLPRALDQSLFAGMNAHWLRAAGFACLWLMVWLVAAGLLTELRQRRLRVSSGAEPT